MTLSIQPAASAPGAQTSAQTETSNPTMMKSAQDFEAMTIGELLEPMFETVDTAHGLFGGGAGEETFKPMLVTEMAKEFERRGGLGMANDIYGQMLKMQEAKR